MCCRLWSYCDNTVYNTAQVFWILLLMLSKKDVFSVGLASLPEYNQMQLVLIYLCSGLKAAFLHSYRHVSHVSSNLTSCSVFSKLIYCTISCLCVYLFYACDELVKCSIHTLNSTPPSQRVLSPINYKCVLVIIHNSFTACLIRSGWLQIYDRPLFLLGL